MPLMVAVVEPWPNAVPVVSNSAHNANWISLNSRMRRIATKQKARRVPFNRRSSGRACRF